ncbi:type 1 glutamine amidotransferase [Algoriphagus halophytocola]|uniref:Type 1 glutamine amidotransferase n=1 Tax=Algoriphagus halophytocola TaxID=2991499 RepID=A0ABY6MCU0_9BACT|nr:MULTISPECIES: type 1 glutamine amidotransferase domain-containing protein [unclassified Algoriphagus]UZD21510.1 type 1 glutamine amidotransferase [Algoriphagus sp. TR-M5]WBL42722.1 type 1 glutamine amidotransferase [Algoriphagus sp. TR-M9]
MSLLKDVRVAILATNGFEESELIEPQRALEKEGAEVFIISTENDHIKGWKDGNWSEAIKVDARVDQVSSKDFDSLLLPGGVINPDLLRREMSAVEFVKSFFEDHKPVAAICHGPQMLIEAEVVNGRTLTSFESIRKDLENAGAHWVDEEVVVDSGLVTSRSPKDLPAFNKKMVEEFREGKHAGQTA